tara:strand:- start:1041 stop:1667 length:627 start_codon:yes stop_codon:yes gene_type:complete
MKLAIYNKSGKVGTDKVTLNDNVFKIEPNNHCIYLAINSEMAAIRQGTHSSKTRGEVRGSGAKPWRQKGTGRARVGSVRNPSRVHGSKAFGPKPHGYIKKVNKKVRILARKSVLSQKVSDKNLLVLDDFNLKSSKTKDFLGLINNLKIDDKKIVLIANDIGDELYFSSRNVKNVALIPVKSASTYDLLDCNIILADVESIKTLNKDLS